MFFVEFGAGLFTRSNALLGDSLDMLGDTLVYGISLYVLSKDNRWRARSALIKGLVMLAFGIGVLVDAALKLQAGSIPVVPAMAGVGALALAANTICFALLWRHRTADINFRSTWLCSRNDLVANSAVIMAAFFVARLQSVWPDVLVGVGIAGLFLWTAFGVLHDAVSALRRVNPGDTSSAVRDKRPLKRISRDKRRGEDRRRVASKEDIEALVAQPQKRSAVYDVVTNPTNVTVHVNKQ